MFLYFVYADKPEALLSLGKPLKPNDIKEGDDVYFECIIRANPPVQRISWYHNVSGIHPLIRSNPPV